MSRFLIIISLALLTEHIFSQVRSVNSFLADTSMSYASASICVKDADNGEIILEHNSGTSLIPASVMKLITSAAAIEMLGPQYRFKTTLGYSGSLNMRTGKLSGNIIIRGRRSCPGIKEFYRLLSGFPEQMGNRCKKNRDHQS